METVIEAIKGDQERFREEAADLFFHYLVLLEQTGVSLEAIITSLQRRRK